MDHKSELLLKKITINQKGDILFLDPLKIVVIQNIGDAGIYIRYTYLQKDTDQSVLKSDLVRDSLKNMEAILPKIFFRTSRNCLLNILFIDKIQDCKVVLKVKEGIHLMSFPTTIVNKNRIVKMISLNK